MNDEIKEEKEPQIEDAAKNNGTTDPRIKIRSNIESSLSMRKMIVIFGAILVVAFVIPLALNRFSDAKSKTPVKQDTVMTKSCNNDSSITVKK